MNTSKHYSKATAPIYYYNTFLLSYQYENKLNVCYKINCIFFIIINAYC